jgi:hypothetical protein
MCNLQQLLQCGQDDVPDALARLPVRETLRPLLVAKISRWKLDPMCMATDLSSAAAAAKKKKSAAAPVTDKVWAHSRVKPSSPSHSDARLLLSPALQAKATSLLQRRVATLRLFRTT